LNYFSKRKSVNRVHEMVNRAVLQSTVDSRRWHPERLVGAWLADAAEPRSSPRIGEKRGELQGVLIKGFGDRLDGEARPAAVKGERRRWNSVWGEWGCKGVEPRAAKGAVMIGGVKWPFYRPAWRSEASGGGQPVVEFNSVDFEE
jgi:hypothetical protein